jgi:hypothetical protein
MQLLLHPAIVIADQGGAVSGRGIHRGHLQSGEISPVNSGVA